MRAGPSHPLFPQVADLFDEYRVHYGQPSDPAAVRDWLRGEPLTVHAAVDAEEPRGLITTVAVPASLRLGVNWWVRDLYVPPRHRRLGVARALLRHVAAEARAAGVLRLSLQTEAANAPALALYRSLGFAPVRGYEVLDLNTADSF